MVLVMKSNRSYVQSDQTKNDQVKIILKGIMEMILMSICILWTQVEIDFKTNLFLVQK